MLQKTRSKKGFTLAELLIVVAIIAVLTAIAVPLFVSGVKKAQDATLQANIRAVRGEAVAVILMAESGDDMYIDTVFGGATTAYVEATVDKSGNMGPVSISSKKAETTEYGGEEGQWDGDKQTTIVVKLTKTDLSKKVGG